MPKKERTLLDEFRTMLEKLDDLNMDPPSLLISWVVIEKVLGTDPFYAVINANEGNYIITDKETFAKMMTEVNDTCPHPVYKTKCPDSLLDVDILYGGSRKTFTLLMSARLGMTMVMRMEDRMLKLVLSNELGNPSALSVTYNEDTGEVVKEPIVYHHDPLGEHARYLLNPKDEEDKEG